jgi:hypothetical protein
MTATTSGAEEAVPAHAADPSIASTGNRQRSRSERRTTVFRVLLAVGVSLVITGAVLWASGAYTHNMIQDQLVAQQIRFPPADSFGMSAEEYPTLQQYAGQLVDDGPTAKAWANEFMTPHILELSDGVPYGVYSATAFQDPEINEADVIAKEMAIGEVQRGLLLSAWGWWTIGSVMSVGGLVITVIGALALIGAAVVRFTSSRSPAEHATA